MPHSEAVVTPPEFFHACTKTVSSSPSIGGHTAGVLSRLHEDGFVIAFDRDIQALDNKIDDPRLILIHNNFRFIYNYGVLARRKGLAALSAGEQPTAGVGKQLTAKAGVASGRPSGSFAETREYALSPEGLPEAEGQPAQEAEGAVFDGILADLGVSTSSIPMARPSWSASCACMPRWTIPARPPA